jgi:hypothetical protein
VQVQWESTAVFTSDSVVIPTPEFLNGVIDEALDSPEDYIDSLSLLSSENPFSTTTEVMFATPKDPPSSSSSTTTRNNASGLSGIIGAVAGLTVVLAGFVLYRNGRRQGEHRSDTNHNVGKGDTTVAGDTFTGDTHNSSTDDDDASTDKCTRTGILWTNPKDNRPKQIPQSSVVSSRQAVEDYDAFVSSRNDWGSMSDVLSDALASMTETDDEDDRSQSHVKPLYSTLRRLKEDIDDMKMEIGDETNIGTKVARRPKTVAEIEQLLADSKEFGR